MVVLTGSVAVVAVAAHGAEGSTKHGTKRSTRVGRCWPTTRKEKREKKKRRQRRERQREVEAREKSAS